MKSPRNVWYVAALESELGGEPLRRIILSMPIVFYRAADGNPVALQDRCPHRFAPLSRGHVEGDRIVCGYHGLAFGRDGKCAGNPHGDIVAPHLRVDAYPVELRHGLVWVWPGEAGHADPGMIPDLGYMTEDGVRTVHSRLDVGYRADILVDNLMDLSHADYLHVGSFSGGPPEKAETSVREADGTVIVERSHLGAPPPPHLHFMGPSIDMHYEIRWYPGNVMTYVLTVTPVGGTADQAVRLPFSHIATPGSDGRTIYFMSATRSHALDDPEVDEQMAAGQVRVIDEEDSPMLYAVDEQMDGAELMDMKPVVLPCDIGALRVRQTTKKLWLREQAASSPV